MTTMNNGLALASAILLTAGSAWAAAPKAELRLPAEAAQASVRVLAFAIDALPCAQALRVADGRASGLREAQPARTPFSASMGFSSPDWNISRTMSLPPTNSPLT